MCNEKRITGNVFFALEMEKEYNILNDILVKYNIAFLQVFYSNGKIRVKIERFDEYQKRKMVCVLFNGDITNYELTLEIIHNIINFRENETDYECGWTLI